MMRPPEDEEVTAHMFSKHGPGSGSSLPFPVLLVAGLCTVAATCISAMSISLHLKNYRKPMLQRQVVRIMLMVPIYAIASLISLFSLDAAFFIDVVRDIYEAFVIYCFFDLLIAYLGGERSLLIALHGRPPKYPVFPSNIFWREVDVSDPYTFLFLKRGVIQYVQVKPTLAIATVILKLTGKFNEGNLAANSGYLYVSIVYNVSICLALYCLAIFWMCVSEDLKPFRPMPKFLCVKGVLFFSFWQSLFVSILVAAGAIKKLGPYTDAEHISLGLTDTLICFEMPFFAVAHMYAFATRDFTDAHTQFVARMPIAYALRDAFGFKDVIEDTKKTLHGEGIDYREFEPSEGFIHQGAGRDRRIRAGLRYAQGGKKKYWLPQPATSTQPRGSIDRVMGADGLDEVYAPLLQGQAENIVHTASDLRSPLDEGFGLFASGHADDLYSLEFELDADVEELFESSKKFTFGDYLYPSVDVSSEAAKNKMWAEEERILRDERNAYFSPLTASSRLPAHPINYGATAQANRALPRSRHDSYASDASGYKGKSREDASLRPEIVIDMEVDRLPPASDDAVRLRWTSSKDQLRRSPNMRTLSAATPDMRASSSLPASSASSPRSRPPPSTQREAERSMFPPDAVDLVVEDANAAQQEMSHERRKGEPAMHGSALRKMYRRGYVLNDHGELMEGEVEVEAAPHEEAIFAVADEADEVLPEEDAAVESMAARTEASSSHPAIRFSPDIIEDENPWA